MKIRHKNKEGTRRKLIVKSLGVAALFTLSFSFSSVSAQESLNTTGGNVLGSGGSVSYSIGQLTYQTYTGTNGSVSEGVQQPYEISIVTATELAKGVNLSISAYPNPTTDYLTLSIDELEISNLSFQLYDMKAKLLQNEKITDKHTNIVMSNLPTATYFVKVMQGSKEIKTFKIVKR